MPQAAFLSPYQADPMAPSSLHRLLHLGFSCDRGPGSGHLCAGTPCTLGVCTGSRAICSSLSQPCVWPSRLHPSLLTHTQYPLATNSHPQDCPSALRHCSPGEMLHCSMGLICSLCPSLSPGNHAALHMREPQPLQCWWLHPALCHCWETNSRHFVKTAGLEPEVPQEMPELAVES